MVFYLLQNYLAGCSISTFYTSIKQVISCFKLNGILTPLIVFTSFNFKNYKSYHDYFLASAAGFLASLADALARCLVFNSLICSLFASARL